MKGGGHYIQVKRDTMMLISLWDSTNEYVDKLPLAVQKAHRMLYGLETGVSLGVDEIADELDIAVDEVNKMLDMDIDELKNRTLEERMVIANIRAVLNGGKE